MFGVLLVHSFGSTNSEFSEFEKLLQEQGFRTNAPLLPGHGTSPDDLENYTYETWINSCENELYKLNCQGMFVIGQVTGAPIALTLAAHHPELLGIVTLSGIISHHKQNIVINSLLKPYSSMFPLIIKENPYTENKPEILKKTNLYQKVPLRSIQETYYLMNKSKKLLKIINQPIFVLHANNSNTISTKNAETIFHEVSSLKKKLMYIEKGGVIMTLDVAKNIVFKEIINFLWSCINLYQV